MRIVIQRVKEASVSINEVLSAKIGSGMLILLGIEDADRADDIDWLTSKIVKLRIFDDEQGVMNRSLLDTGAEVLAVSQFTLYACTRKGNRPSYIRASKPDLAVPMYRSFCEELSKKTGKPVATGVFGADMQIALVNDGPVTIIIDSKQRDF